MIGFLKKRAYSFDICIHRILSGTHTYFFLYCNVRKVHKTRPDHVDMDLGMNNYVYIKTEYSRWMGVSHDQMDNDQDYQHSPDHRHPVDRGTFPFFSLRRVCPRRPVLNLGHPRSLSFYYIPFGYRPPWLLLNRFQNDPAFFDRFCKCPRTWHHTGRGNQLNGGCSPWADRRGVKIASLVNEVHLYEEQCKHFSKDTYEA